MNKDVFANDYEQNWESCEYLECIYEERDTGYREYECELGFTCNRCPFDIKYSVEE